MHSLRNILAAMTYGLDALDVVAPKASREREFINIQAALRKQIELLKDAVVEAARLLESPPPAAASSPD